MTLASRQRGSLVVFALMLLAAALILAGGSASAQTAVGDDYGIWYKQGTAAKPGGVLQPNISIDANLEPCSIDGWDCEERDGFLVYFGNDANMSMNDSYLISVDGLEHPNIQVTTFYDSLYIDEYAARFRTQVDNPNSLGIDVREFARRIGLHTVCNELDADYGDQVCDQVATVPIGTLVAANNDRAGVLPFQPIAGDIGAYLITVSSFDIHESGRYRVSLARYAFG